MKGISVSSCGLGGAVVRMVQVIYYRIQLQTLQMRHRLQRKCIPRSESGALNPDNSFKIVIFVDVAVHVESYHIVNTIGRIYCIQGYVICSDRDTALSKGPIKITKGPQQQWRKEQIKHEDMETFILLFLKANLHTRATRLPRGPCTRCILCVSA